MNLSQIQGRLSWLPSRIHDHFPTRPMRREAVTFSSAFFYIRGGQRQHQQHLPRRPQRRWSPGERPVCCELHPEAGRVPHLCGAVQRPGCGRQQEEPLWPVSACCVDELKKEERSGWITYVTSHVVKKWRPVWWSFHSDDINTHVFPHLGLKKHPAPFASPSTFIIFGILLQSLSRLQNRPDDNKYSDNQKSADFTAFLTNEPSKSKPWI